MLYHLVQGTAGAPVGVAAKFAPLDVAAASGKGTGDGSAVSAKSAKSVESKLAN